MRHSCPLTRVRFIDIFPGAMRWWTSWERVKRDECTRHTLILSHLVLSQRECKPGIIVKIYLSSLVCDGVIQRVSLNQCRFACYTRLTPFSISKKKKKWSLDCPLSKEHVPTSNRWIATELRAYEQREYEGCLHAKNRFIYHTINVSLVSSVETVAILVIRI